MDLQIAIQSHAKVEEFTRKHRAGLLALVFTDIVGATKLKQELGDREAVTLIQRHRASVREILSRFSQGEEIETAGDSFFMVFTKPSDAAKFALLMQAAIRSIAAESGRMVFHRIGIHVGEVWIEEHEGGGKAKDLYGLQVDTCARVQSLAEGDQILLTRFAFDEARRVLRGEDLAGVGALSWLNHGPYKLKGVEEVLEICEVGELQKARLTVPPDTEKARRFISADSEPVLGWRPAVDQPVPGTSWILEQKLGEGGFGEVWLGHDKVLKSRHVFKFCFRADRVRSLRREVTLFRLLKQHIGQHPNIVGVEQVYFDEPPFYIVMNYVEGQDLSAWFEKEGGPKNIPLSDRIGIVAQIADALQAAHDSGVIHRDVKPSNILVSRHSDIHAYLTDFGIGQIVSQEVLNRLTLSGFTQTIMDSGSRSGTQLYMAPELISGNPASIRSDIYALGVVLYQLVVGDFSRAVTTDWAKQITDPLLREDLEKCFAGDPQDRFAGAGQLANQLRSLEERRAAYEKQQAILKARERAAYRRGIMRTAALALVVIALVSGLAIYSLLKRQEALAERAEAQKQALNFKQQLVEASLSDHSTAEDHFRKGNGREAIAYLRRALQYNPENNAARNHLWSALVYGEGQQRGQVPLVALLSKDEIKNAEFSPDGTRVITVTEVYTDGSFNRIEQIWDATTGAPQGEPLVNTDTLSSAIFSPDGMRVLTASEDHTATIWDVATGKQIGRPLHHDDKIVAGSFSPDGTEIVTASEDHTARIWDAKTGTPIGQPLQTVKAASFSPDGTRIVTASEDHTARIWDAKTGNPIGQPLQTVEAASFSPDGTRILTVGFDSVCIWDSETRKPLVELKSRDTDSAVFSPDGKRVLIVSFDSESESWVRRVWEAETGELRCLPMSHNDNVGAVVLDKNGQRRAGVNSVAFSPDGKRIVTSGEDHTARLWDAETGEPLGKPMRHSAAVNSAVFSADGKRIVTASNDRTARIWDATNEPAGQTFLGDAFLSPDGTRVATILNDTVQIWDATTGKAVGETMRGSWGAFSPDGARIVVTSDHIVQIWDATSGKAVGQVNPHVNEIQYPILNRDGTRLAILAGDTVQIWDATSGKAVGEPMGGLLHIAAFSPDGTRIVVVSKDAVQIRDAVSGKALGQARRHGDLDVQSAFNRDGTRIAIIQDDTVQIWDAASGKAVSEPIAIAANKYGSKTAVLSADGTSIAIVGNDTVQIRDTTGGRPISQVMHCVDAGNVTFSPDGTRIAVVSDQRVQIWEVKSSRRLGDPFGVNVEQALFSADGNGILTLSWSNSSHSDSNTARIWDAKTGQPLSEPMRQEDANSDSYSAISGGYFSPDATRIVTISTRGAKIWEVPDIQDALPPWFDLLLDYVSGLHFSANGTLQALTAEEYADAVNGLRKVAMANSGWDQVARRLMHPNENPSTDFFGF